MKKLCIPLFSLLITACASADFNDGAATETPQEWFVQSLAREVNIETSAEISIPELNVSSEVKGNFSMRQEDENFWYFVAEVPDAAPVECHVYGNQVYDGAANTLYSILEYELDYISEHFEQPVENRSIYGLDVGITGNTPYIALDTSYTIEVENEIRGGIVKAISAQTRDNLVICLHNEIGFKGTFFSLADSFISAVANGNNTQDNDTDIFFESVLKLSMNDTPVGFSRELFSSDADGDIKIVREQSIAAPVDDATLTRSDTRDIEWSFPDGATINATIYTVVNGEEKSNLSLWVSEDEWQVQGSSQGKDVKTTLAHDGWIASTYGSYLAHTSLLDSQEQSEDYNMWIPAADPSAVTPIKVSKIMDNPSVNMNVLTGPISMDFFVDEKGVLQRAFMQQGPLNQEFNSMYSFGSPVRQ